MRLALLALATTAATAPEAPSTGTVVAIAAAIAGVVVLRGVLLRAMRKRSERRRRGGDGATVTGDAGADKHRDGWGDWDGGGGGD